MNPLFITPITNTADAEGFLFQMYQHGLDFHPEDNPADIIDTRTGQPLFTPAEADAVSERMEEVFMHMADPCEYLLDLINSTDRQ